MEPKLKLSPTQVADIKNLCMQLCQRNEEVTAARVKNAVGDALDLKPARALALAYDSLHKYLTDLEFEVPAGYALSPVFRVPDPPVFESPKPRSKIQLALDHIRSLHPTVVGVRYAEPESWLYVDEAGEAVMFTGKENIDLLQEALDDADLPSFHRWQP